MRPAHRFLRSLASVIALHWSITGCAAAAAMTFVVTTASDAGPGSLRQAIQDANANPGADEIRFAAPRFGVLMIAPLTPLPPVTDQVTIDGSSPARPDQHLITIDGSRLHPDAFGLELQGQGSRVNHLVLHGFAPAFPALGGAVLLAGTGLHTVTDCRLGTDASGLVEVANHVGIQVNSPGNTIAGNLISASWDTGIDVFADGNLIDRNLLGSNRDGQPFGASSQASQLWGVSLFGSRNQVRHNLIGGSVGGIWISGASDNIVTGNSFGSSSSGTRLGHLDWGVAIASWGNGNVVGRAAPGEGNSFAYLGSSWLTPFGSAVWVDAGAANSVRGNLVSDLDPGAMVIDLGTPGPDANDWGDFDSGPNNLQNAPLLLDAREDPSGAGVRVEGELDTAAPWRRTSYAIDVYASLPASPMGTCETGRYLGSHVLNTTPAMRGLAPFSFLLPVAVPFGTLVSATATVLSPQPADTSEVSPCVTVR